MRSRNPRLAVLMTAVLLLSGCRLFGAGGLGHSQPAASANGPHDTRPDTPDDAVLHQARDNSWSVELLSTPDGDRCIAIMSGDTVGMMCSPLWDDLDTPQVISTTVTSDDGVPHVVALVAGTAARDVTVNASATGRSLTLASSSDAEARLAGTDVSVHVADYRLPEVDGQNRASLGEVEDSVAVDVDVTARYVPEP